MIVICGPKQNNFMHNPVVHSCFKMFMIYSRVKRTSILKVHVMECVCVWLFVCGAICASHMVAFVLVIIHTDFMQALQYQYTSSTVALPYKIYEWFTPFRHQIGVWFIHCWATHAHINILYTFSFRACILMMDFFLFPKTDVKLIGGDCILTLKKKKKEK